MADFLGVKDGNTFRDCKDTTARNSITAIEGLIPSTASSSNKLVTEADIPAVPDLGLVVSNNKLCVRYQK